ncbi:MAG: hypothetical protein CR974_03180 [Gammaproteobacteria bacterium]|nr:MAG: hypothetical protein CR974_03180 [Gammaproteobacteria bacterium]
MKTSPRFADYWREIKTSIRLALPFTVNQVLILANVTVDSIMAGSDSTLTLAAISQGVAMWDLVILFMLGLLLPISAKIAKLDSASNAEALQATFWNMVYFAMLLGAVAVGMLYFSYQLLPFIGIKPAIIPDTKSYLQTIAVGAFLLIAIYFPFKLWNESILNLRIIVAILSLSVPVNIIGNYMFIHGLFGLPKMGATGIALASVIGLSVSCGLAAWYMLSAPKIKRYHLFDHISKPDWQYFKAFFRLGLPSSFAMIFEVGAFTFVIFLAGRIGVETSAATQVAFNYMSNMFMIPLGISLALSMRIARAKGKGDTQKVRDIGISGASFISLIALLSMTILLVFDEAIAGLYSDDPQLIALSSTLLFVIALLQIPDGLLIFCSCALRGLENTKIPMLLGFLGYWGVAIPLGLLLTFYFALGIQGMLIGIVVGTTLSASLGLVKFFQHAARSD